MSKKKIILLIAAPLVLFYVSLFVGRSPIDPLTVAGILLSKIFPITPDWSATAETIVMQFRLPRSIMAMCVGAGLSISGAAFQGMFRNPLVSTDVLGVSAASGFGAALALLISANMLQLQLLSFVFGLAGVALTYFLARVYKTVPVLMLVLSGIVVSAFFSALVAGVKFTVDAESRLPSVTFWLMGSFSRASLGNLVPVVIAIGLCVTILMLVRWQLNILSMGDDEAHSLGIRTELLKGIIIACTTLITASSVSICGLVGWVGLVIPHAGRALVGPDHKKLFPVTLAIGAAYMLIIDILARTLTDQELPIGILTALIGAPCFAYLLRRTKGGWK